MGCFNKMGFYSHLPITYGDDIVMFICVDNTHSYESDANSIYIDTFYSPYCLPIYGKYNDYGFIEDIVKDANTNLLEKRFGQTIEEILDLIYRKDNSYPRDIKYKYEDMFESAVKEGEVPSFILTMERRDVFDAMVQISNKPYFDKYACEWLHSIGDFWLSMLGFIKKEEIEQYGHYRYDLDGYNCDYYIKSNGRCPKIVNTKTLVEYSIYKGCQELIEKWKELTGIELKFTDESLYDKNIIDLSFEITSDIFYANFKDENDDVILNLENVTDEKLRELIEDYKRISKTVGKGNFFTDDHYTFVSDGKKKFPNDIIPFNNYCCLLFRNSMYLYDDYYNIFTEDFKKICCDFAKFNYTLSGLCGKYDVSMYGNQSVADKFYLNNFTELNEAYSRTINKLKSKYGNEEETE